MQSKQTSRTNRPQLILNYELSRPKEALRPTTESKYIHTTRVETQKQIERISITTIILRTCIRMHNVFTNWTNVEQGNTQHRDSIYHYFIIWVVLYLREIIFNLYLSSQIYITVTLCAKFQTSVTGVYVFTIFRLNWRLHCAKF